jgi:hypothetical protein
VDTHEQLVAVRSELEAACRQNEQLRQQVRVVMAFCTRGSSSIPLCDPGMGCGTV